MNNIYAEMFFSFAKIGAFTLGGGYAMLPMIQAEVVDRKHWIDKDDFMEYMAISQSAPGILAVNISIFIGYKLRGIKGSLAATAGSILPSFLTILAIAALFQDYSSNEIASAVFKGIRPAVVALIAVPAVNMVRTYRLDAGGVILAVVAMILIAVGGISPILILAAVIIYSIANTIIRTRKSSRRNKR